MASRVAGAFFGGGSGLWGFRISSLGGGGVSFLRGVLGLWP